MTPRGARTDALPTPGTARPSNHARTRPAVLAQDGWAAWFLGTVAQCYLVILVALTAIAAVPLGLGWGGSVVQTGSMRPDISPGSVVLTTDLPDSSPVPLGAVVQFRATAPDGQDRLVLHRIVAAGENRGEWITQGDANADPDSSVLTRDMITGQGRVLVRWVGLPSLWLAAGELGKILAWLALTVAAAWLVAWSWPRREPVEAPLGADQGPTRRTALLAVVAVVGGATLVPSEPAHAAFSARTAMTGNTFSVGTWPTLALGRASTYAVLASTRVANVAALGIGSDITGSVAVTPGTTVTGFWPWDITGSTDRNTVGARNARTDAVALYDAARTRTATATAPATVTGTLRSGVHRRAGAVDVQGTLTLDARGDSSAIFVLQGSSLTFAANASVALVNGASADRVFFVSTSTAVVGEAASVRGVLLASGDIALQRGSRLTGRAISLNGAVTLTAAAVTQP
ncbi:ice-binding family protein [uncultured Cellulomonas sp.]|uniref:ice-binding family protein n=1 Tax=uncultured Cellulomonas sp. TaxID=189682 RepID=UPI0028E28132|nr:ice-binding family protein [uncultured Cellulomonas sp.]